MGADPESTPTDPELESPDRVITMALPASIGGLG